MNLILAYMQHKIQGIHAGVLRAKPFHGFRLNRRYSNMIVQVSQIGLQLGELRVQM